MEKQKEALKGAYSAEKVGPVLYSIEIPKCISNGVSICQKTIFTIRYSLGMVIFKA